MRGNRTEECAPFYYTLLEKARHPARLNWQQFCPVKSPKSFSGLEPSLPRQNATPLPLVLPPLPHLYLQHKLQLGFSYHLIPRRRESNPLHVEYRCTRLRPFGRSTDWATEPQFFSQLTLTWTRRTHKSALELRAKNCPDPGLNSVFRCPAPRKQIMMITTWGLFWEENNQFFEPERRPTATAGSFRWEGNENLGWRDPRDLDDDDETRNENWWEIASKMTSSFFIQFNLFHSQQSHSLNC